MPGKWGFAGGAGLGLACLFAGVAAGQAPPVPSDSPTRDRQIAEVQQQIEALNKKLEELRRPKPAPGNATEPIALGPDWLKPLTWRSLGPASMGGRVVALAVVEGDPSAFWVATASGGLLKTVNNGTTFEHQFDREGTVSLGDVAVAPSNREVVWVGTGEANPRNSVSFGDGVYASTDGGKTWAHKGLRGSYQIGKLAIHPTDPNTVYAGALGRLYGPSEERGLYKTADGGKTWAKVLGVDDRTGVVDIRLSPADPETLLVATYERRRDRFDLGDPAQRFGPGSALHRSTDGGKTFTKVTAGLPTVKLGRIGLDFSRKDPKVVFAIVESEKIGTGPAPPKGAKGQGYVGITGENPETGPGAKVREVVPGGPAAKAGLQAGDLITAVGPANLSTYLSFVEQVRERKVGDALPLKVTRGGKTLDLTLTLEPRPAPAVPPGANAEGFGGLQLDPSRPFGALLGGQIENAQDRQGPEGFETGGVYRSADAGLTWVRVNSLNPRPFYFSQVRVDPSDESRVYALGLALHQSDDGGKTLRGDASRGVHSDHHALWIDPRDGRHLLLGGDGGLYASYDRGKTWDHLNHVAIGQFYHVALDARRPYRAYGGLQDNGSWGGPSVSRTGNGPINEDWVGVGGGDGFRCAVDPTDPDLVYSTSQYGSLSRRNLRTGEAAFLTPVAERGKIRRYNWNTPILLSHHNPKVFYAAGEVVFRSPNQGNDLRAISPELSRTKEGTITALAESPANPDVLYAGTDDGALWVTRNGGKDWSDVAAHVGLDRPCYVATLEASKASEGRAYVAFDGHRSDLDDPLVFATEDFGATWRPLRANLPRGPSRTLREDPQNADLLYLGTEFAVWASLDRGTSWNKLNTNLPTVAVHEIAIHPTAGEVVAATHGRSLWALDVAPLRALTRDTLKAKATLLKPTPTFRLHRNPERGGTNRKFQGQNPPPGATFYVALGAKAEKATLKVLDYDGSTAHEQRVPLEPGLHKLTWNLNKPEAAGVGPTPGRGGRFLRRVVPAAPGLYKVVLTVDGQESSQTLKVEADPEFPEVAGGVEEFIEGDEAEEGAGEGEGEID